MATQDSFATRVKATFNGQFKPCMSRALLLVTLFEANRCVLARSQDMRPFQRKIAILWTAMDLLQSLEFLSDEQKSMILSLGTKNGNRPIIARLAFRRAESLEDEIRSVIFPGIEKLVECEKNHDEVCEEFVQDQFEKQTEKTGPAPPLWVFRQFPLFLVYRVYYRDLALDPSLFPAIPPRFVDVPCKRPDDNFEYVVQNWSPIGKCAANESSGMDTEIGDASPTKSRGCMVANQPTLGAKKRLQILMEIKMRMDLLKEMEGAFPENYIAKEKRILFRAMPPVDTKHAKNNRHAFLAEMKLRMEVMKGMKGVLPLKRYGGQMKKILLSLPSLDAVVERRDNAVVSEEVNVGNLDKEGDTGHATDSAWVAVDAVEDLKTSVSDIEIV